MARKYGILVLAIAALSFCLVASAQAVTIVDTGAGPQQGGLVLANSQWLAGEFNILQPYTISDVYGWISNYSGGTATLAIYTDGGEIPGSQLHSTQFSIPAGGDVVANWYGASGLNWNLGSGTYWAAFEVRGGDTYGGAMPYSSPNPLANESFASWGSWHDSSPSGLGIRIFANEGNVIPEPASLSLLGLGLLGLLRKRKIDFLK